MDCTFQFGADGKGGLRNYVVDLKARDHKTVIVLPDHTVLRPDRWTEEPAPLMLAYVKDAKRGNTPEETAELNGGTLARLAA